VVPHATVLMGRLTWQPEVPRETVLYTFEASVAQSQARKLWLTVDGAGSFDGIPCLTCGSSWWKLIALHKRQIFCESTPEQSVSETLHQMQDALLCPLVCGARSLQHVLYLLGVGAVERPWKDCKLRKRMKASGDQLEYEATARGWAPVSALPQGGVEAAGPARNPISGRSRVDPRAPIEWPQPPC